MSASGPAGGWRRPTPHAAGIVLVLAAALLWSTSGIFIKVLTVHSFALTGLRSGLAFVSLLPFLPRERIRLERPLITLVLAFSATQLTFVIATRWTTAANAIALQSTAPAWVFLFTWLATRRLHLPLAVPIVLILGGIAAMMSEPAHGTTLQGNVLGAVSGVSFALTQMSFQRVRVPVVTAVALANLGSAVTCVLLQPRAFALGAIPAWEWTVLVYLGAVQTALAFLCFTTGVRRITVGQASILTLAEPVLNPVWVFLAIGEIPSAYGFTGAGLILSGILADLWLRLRRPGLVMGPRQPDDGRA